MQSANQDSPEKPRHNIIGKIPHVFSYVASASIGGFVGANETRKLNYKAFAKKGYFNEIQKTRNEAVDKVLVAAQESKGAKPSPQETESLLKHLQGVVDSVMQPDTTAKAIKILKEGYRQQVKDWYAERNMKNIADYWIPLEKTDRIQVATVFFTVAGIALATLLTAANSKSVSHLLTREDDKDKSAGIS